MYMEESALVNVLPAGSVFQTGNTAQKVGGGIYMGGKASLTLDGVVAKQVMGANPPDNALLWLLILASHGGPTRTKGNATLQLYEINGGAICSCPPAPAPAGGAALALTAITHALLARSFEDGMRRRALVSELGWCTDVCVCGGGAVDYFQCVTSG
jgi:predicted outer membrane repeat protein